MQPNTNPTPYADINALLLDFLNNIKKILGNHFIGMYLYGSLAMGDFDPHTSDIDFIIITDTDVSKEVFISLQNLHKQFDLSDSPWSKKIEAAYIELNALGRFEKISTQYPQIEKGKQLLLDQLDIGWAFQCHTLREYGIIIAGVNPKTFINPVSHNDMLLAATTIIELWHKQAHDKQEVKWLKQRDEQAFVVLTICRFLYLLKNRTEASKIISAHWAQKSLNKKWHNLIGHALTKKDHDAVVTDSDVKNTITLIDYAAECLAKNRLY